MVGVGVVFVVVDCVAVDLVVVDASLVVVQDPISVTVTVFQSVTVCVSVTVLVSGQVSCRACSARLTCTPWATLVTASAATIAPAKMFRMLKKSRGFIWLLTSVMIGLREIVLILSSFPGLPMG